MPAFHYRHALTHGASRLCQKVGQLHARTAALASPRLLAPRSATSPLFRLAGFRSASPTYFRISFPFSTLAGTPLPACLPAPSPPRGLMAGAVPSGVRRAFRGTLLVTLLRCSSFPQFCPGLCTLRALGSACARVLGLFGWSCPRFLPLALAARLALGPGGMLLFHSCVHFCGFCCTTGLHPVRMLHWFGICPGARFSGMLMAATAFASPYAFVLAALARPGANWFPGPELHYVWLLALLPGGAQLQLSLTRVFARLESMLSSLWFPALACFPAPLPPASSNALGWPFPGLAR